MPDTTPGGDTRGVEDHPARAQHVVEAVLADEDEEHRTQAHERMRAKARRLLAPLALQPDQRGEHERKAELSDLPPSLVADCRQHKTRTTQNQ